MHVVAKLILSTLPKTLNKIHDLLNNCDLITNRGKHFLFVNDIQTNMYYSIFL